MPHDKLLRERQGRGNPEPSPELSEQEKEEAKGLSIIGGRVLPLVEGVREGNQQIIDGGDNGGGE